MPNIEFSISGVVSPVPDSDQAEALLPQVSDALLESFESVLAANSPHGSSDLMGFEILGDTKASLEFSEEAEASTASANLASWGWGDTVSLPSRVIQEVGDSFELEGGFELSSVEVEIGASEITIEDINYG